MRITSAARELGISADWLRRLERHGRLPPARRDLRGHRRYTAEDVHLLRQTLFPTGAGTTPRGTRLFLPKDVERVREQRDTARPPRSAHTGGGPRT
jgi:MerR HTH family regulatory protein